MRLRCWLSLLVAGSLSDHIGRRPVVFTALLLQAGAMLTFLLAESINGIIAARIVQGIATGMVSGALTAAVVEAAPAAQKRLGAMIRQRLAAGGPGRGRAADRHCRQYALHPVPLVFGVLAAICVVGAVATLFLPESVTPRPGALASLVPRISMPVQARAEFVRGVPTMVACGPSRALPVAGAVDAAADLRHPQRHRQRPGDCGFFRPGRHRPDLAQAPAARAHERRRHGLLAVGAGLVAVSLATHSVALFFVGTALSGFGGGSAFSAQVQTLAPMAQPHQRANCSPRSTPPATWLSACPPCWRAA
jgi:MFS family permease